jgi:1-acyl-sn-glycerol-3-phosphate acyltransferase
VTSIYVVDGMTAMVFIQQTENWRLMFDIAMVSAFGGLFVVPLQALIQHRSDDKNRSQIIAANNMLNAIFMVASAAMGILALVVIELTIPEYFLVLAIMNMVVATYVYSRVPEFVLRFFIWMLGHTFYRVQHMGLDNIPDTGAAVLVCNQVSLIDAMLITGTYHRPIRFVMDRNITKKKGLKTFFKMANTIPICSPTADINVYEHAFKQIKEELDRGEIICISPKGKLTTDSELNTFKAGIERLLKESPVPVVPMALNGMWGSFFSYKVTLTAGPLQTAATATAASLEKEVKKLLTF